MQLSKSSLINLRHNIPLYFKEVLHADPWSEQEIILNMVERNELVAIGSGHGVSKTHTAGRLPLWFLPCYPHSKVITTAPTERQVRDQLWSELQTAYIPVKQMIGGRYTMKRLDFGPDWFAIGFKSTDYDPVKFQGFHAPRIMGIIDEASGITNEVWDAFMSLQMGEMVKIVALGNRLDPFCRFERCFTSPDWATRIIPSTKSPNITGERDIPGLATQKWIDGRKDEWGEGSIMYKIRVMGLCPQEGLNTLIPLMWLEKIKADRSTINPVPPFYAGLDVADVGADASVLTILDREGKHIASYRWHVRTPQVERNTIDKHKEYKFDKLVVDALGVGTGVFNHLAEMKEFHDVVVPHKGSETSLNEIYANKRAEIWFWVYHALENNEIPCIQDIGYLFQELAGVRKEVDPKGKIKLESKEKFVKRLGRSPDEGDAYTLAYKAYKYRTETGIQKQDISAREELPEAVVMSDFARDQEEFMT